MLLFSDLYTKDKLPALEIHAQHDIVSSHYASSHRWQMGTHLCGSVAPDKLRIESAFRRFQKSYTVYCIRKCFMNLN